MSDIKKTPPGGFKIIINAKQFIWEKEIITYSEVVDLVFPPPHGDQTMFTVQYSSGPPNNPKGTLTKKQEVRIQNNMIFNVSRTDRS